MKHVINCSGQELPAEIMHCYSSEDGKYTGHSIAVSIMGSRMFVCSTRFSPQDVAKRTPRSAAWARGVLLGDWAHLNRREIKKVTKGLSDEEKKDVAEVLMTRKKNGASGRLAKLIAKNVNQINPEEHITFKKFLRKQTNCKTTDDFRKAFLKFKTFIRGLQEQWFNAEDRKGVPDVIHGTTIKLDKIRELINENDRKTSEAGTSV